MSGRWYSLAYFRASHEGQCWNKAIAGRDKTHSWIADPCLAMLTVPRRQLDRLIAEASKLLDDGGRRQARIDELEKAKAKNELTQERLARAISLAKEPPQILVTKLEKCELKLAKIVAKIERLKNKARLCAPPTRQQIVERRDAIVDALRRMSTARHGMTSRCSLAKCSAVPYRQHGGNKVVLNAQVQSCGWPPCCLFECERPWHFFAIVLSTNSSNVSLC